MPGVSVEDNKDKNSDAVSIHTILQYMVMKNHPSWRIGTLPVGNFYM